MINNLAINSGSERIKCHECGQWFTHYIVHKHVAGRKKFCEHCVRLRYDREHGKMGQLRGYLKRHLPRIFKEHDNEKDLQKAIISFVAEKYKHIHVKG